MFVKLCYSGLFLVVVIILLILTQKALYSPWGRMMRAIRDNEEAANAMGKNVVKQHLLIFILGSAIVGIAGAIELIGKVIILRRQCLIMCNLK